MSIWNKGKSQTLCFDRLISVSLQEITPRQRVELIGIRMFGQFNSAARCVECEVNIPLRKIRMRINDGPRNLTKDLGVLSAGVVNQTASNLECFWELALLQVPPELAQQRFCFALRTIVFDRMTEIERATDHTFEGGFHPRCRMPDIRQPTFPVNDKRHREPLLLCSHHEPLPGCAVAVPCNGVAHDIVLGICKFLRTAQLVGSGAAANANDDDAVIFVLLLQL